MNWAAIAVIIDSVVTLGVGYLLKRAVDNAGKNAEDAINQAGSELVKNAPSILMEALKEEQE